MDRLHSMRAFARVVQDGSFAAAARALDISPAVVTRLVADLEDYLGVRLLHRTTRRLSLTDAGKTYLARVNSILGDLDEAEALARAETTEPRGLLRVVAPTSFACHLLARHLPRFFEQCPRVHIAITHGLPESAEADYDISIIAGIGPLHGDFIAHRLGSTHGLACASPRYLSRHGVPQHPQDLMRHRCITLHAPSLARAWILESDDGGKAGAPAEEVEIDPQSALQVSGADLLLAAAVAGVGVALVPSYMAGDALGSGTLVRLLPGWRTRSVEFHAAVPTRRHIPARTRAFLDFLRAIFDPALEDEPWDGHRMPRSAATR